MYQMKTKTISFLLIVLTGSLVYPIGSTLAISAPIATSDSYTISENDILDIHAPGILSNDTVGTGKTLSANLVSDVRNGTLFLNPNGGFVYAPDVNFYGVDSFTYITKDGTQNSTVATVTIYVKQINHTPIARNDSYSVNENSTLNVKGIGVLANDTNPDGNVMTIVLVNNVLNGALVLNQNGSFTYLPHLNFHGTDSFSYKSSNRISSSNIANVTITVNQLSQDPPPTNPILQLLAQIHDLLAKITGIQNEVTSLEEKNKALESRMAQLETSIQNGQINTPSAGGQIQNNEDAQNNGEHGDGENGKNHKGGHNGNEQNDD